MAQYLADAPLALVFVPFILKGYAIISIAYWRQVTSERHLFITISFSEAKRRRGVEQVPTEGGVAEAAFDVPPEHIVQSSRGKGWQGIDIAEVIHPLDDFALPAIPRHVLVVNLGSPTEIRERLVGREGHLERRGEVRHLHLYLSPALIHQVV